MFHISACMNGHLMQSRILTRSQLLAFSTKDLAVKHDSSKSRFYIEMHGELATVDYRNDDKVITFLHTEVPEIFRGRGVAKILAKEAFTFASKNNLKVEIQCDYLKNFYSTNKNKFKDLRVE